MATETLVTYWSKAGRLLGFKVEAPFVVVLPNGHSVAFAVRLPQFGAEHGMLLSESYEDFASHASVLVESGYGYSVLSALCTDEVVREDVIAVLQDWGWSSLDTSAPEWLNET